ncbi:MAG TPA: VOC family protein [Steroidobacteraceae bacterium]|nr:VOC family protein [Steroidobacteraceae bacterium]
MIRLQGTKRRSETLNPQEELHMASIRYIVSDVDRCAEFYRDRLEFKVDMHNPGKFAALERDDLTLYLSAPGAGSGGTAGGNPQPGGWNRLMLVTDDIDALIGRLRQAGVKFRGEMSEAGAGRARLVEDPSGNLVELFEFKKDRARAK